MGARDPVYLDSNAIIRFVESEEHEITTLFQRAGAEGFRLVTSELTLAEALVVPVRRSDDRLRSTYEDFLRGDDILRVVPVDRPVLRRSAELRAAFGSKGPDAIHCATAELSGCTIVVSSDRRFRVPAGMMRVDIEQAAGLGDGS